MNHIEEWKKINKRHEQERESQKEEKDRKLKKRIAKIEAFLTDHGAENISTNGYVFSFDYKGMSSSFCDQGTRIVGSIHRPFLSKEDRECYRDMETQMSMGEASYFIMEYAYHHFCIEGKPWDSLHRVFRLIKNAIVLRQTGVSS